MDGFEKTVNNGLNKVTDENLVDIKPIAENFEMVDDKLGNVGLVELEGYNDAVDGHKDVSNLIKYAFKKAKAGVDGLKDTAIKVTTWSNQTLDKVLQALKDRQADTIKPNLADNSLYDWLNFTITTANSTPYQLNTWINVEGFKVNDYLNISYELRSSALVDDSRVDNYASIIGLNSAGKQVMALNAQAQMYPNSAGVVSLNIKVTQEMIDSGKIKLVAYYLGYSSGSISYRKIKAEKGQISTPYIQSSNDLESTIKDVAVNKTDIANMKSIDAGLRTDITGLQNTRYNLINGGNIPVINTDKYPATKYTIDDKTLKDGDPVTFIIKGKLLTSQNFNFYNSGSYVNIAYTQNSISATESNIYTVKGTWKTTTGTTTADNSSLDIYTIPNSAGSNKTTIDWCVLVRGHVDYINEWIPSKSDLLNSTIPVVSTSEDGLMSSKDKSKLDNLYSAELLDRQDINALNTAINGEDALIDANNIKFAELLGVDINTIKGGGA